MEEDSNKVLKVSSAERYSSDLVIEQKANTIIPWKNTQQAGWGEKCELWQHSAEENIPTGGVWKKHMNVCEAGRITDGANMSSGWWMSCHLTAQSAPCELLSLVDLLVNDIKMWLVIGKQTTWLGLGGVSQEPETPAPPGQYCADSKSGLQDKMVGLGSVL